MAVEFSVDLEENDGVFDWLKSRVDGKEGTEFLPVFPLGTGGGSSCRRDSVSNVFLSRHECTTELMLELGVQRRQYCFCGK